MKLLQLNIFQGKLLFDVIKFVKENDIDILNFQEVSGGKFSRGGLNVYPDGLISKNLNQETIGIDSFETVKNELKYEVINSPVVRIKNDLNSYEGNATFYKNLQLIKKEIVWMRDYKEFDSEQVNPLERPSCAIISTFKTSDKIFDIINTHLAWGPTPFDEQYKIDQANVLFNHLRELKNPFVISGDFNLISSTEIVKMFGTLAKNFTLENKLTNTLNPNIHAVEKLFPPGLAVDYIFTSDGIKVNNFKLIDSPDLSDHFGLLLDFEI